MKKIVLLGNSASYGTCIEQLRASDKGSEIVLISFDGEYPSDRQLFPELLAKEIPGSQLYIRPKEFYEENKVQVIFNNKISRINLKRNKIFFEDKNQLDYDTLVIGDTPQHKFPEMKGVYKSGKFGFKRLDHIQELIKQLPFADTIVVQADSFLGLRIALALLKRGKEVILLLSRPYLFSSFIDQAIADTLQKYLEGKALRIIPNNEIVELLGETELRAIRLKEGKVLACEVVVMETDFEDYRIFNESPLEIKKGVCVNKQFLTSLPNVYALDQVSSWEGQGLEMDPFLTLATLEYQGLMVASSILGENKKLDLPVTSRFLSLEGLSITLLGRLTPQARFFEKKEINDAAFNYSKIWLTEEGLDGALLVNNNTKKLESWLKEKTSLTDLQAILTKEGWSEASSPLESPRPLEIAS